MTENRANVNDGTIWCHRPYYGPLPALADGAPRHNLVAATYPLGVQVKASGDRWDARAAVLDRSPVQRAHHGSPHANGVVGAGFSPRQGLRIGVAGAWGRSGNAETSDPYTLLNIEGEYAFGHTKVGGEWTRGRVRHADRSACGERLDDPSQTNTDAACVRAHALLVHRDTTHRDVG